MKAKVLISIVLLGVLMIGLAVLLVDTDSEQETMARSSDTTEPVETPETEPQSGVGTLASLAERSGPLECSFSYRSSELAEPIEGTFFLRNERVRADFLQEDESLGQIVTSYVLKDEQLYVWSDIQGELYGVQVNLNEATAIDTPLPVPEDEAVRYNCQEWTRIDDSVFEIPTSVLFRDAANAAIEYGTIYEEGEF